MVFPAVLWICVRRRVQECVAWVWVYVYICERQRTCVSLLLSIFLKWQFISQFLALDIDTSEGRVKRISLQSILALKFLFFWHAMMEAKDGSQWNLPCEMNYDFTFELVVYINISFQTDLKTTICWTLVIANVICWLWTSCADIYLNALINKGLRFFMYIYLYSISQYKCLYNFPQANLVMCAEFYSHSSVCLHVY